MTTSLDRDVENSPLDCHRGLMITTALLERGLAPGHLRGDGSVESTAQMESRLLQQTKVGVGISDGLFAALLTASERRHAGRGVPPPGAA